jgi:hypothetical protein
VLVQLTRATADPVELDATTLAVDAGTAALDHDDLRVRDGHLHLPAADGATARAWRLPPLHLEPISP